MIAAIPLIKWWPLAAVVAAFAAGWTINGWRCGAGKADGLVAAIEDKAAKEKKGNALSAGEAASNAALSDEKTKLARRLDREVTKDPYRVRLPADGLRTLHRAVTGTDRPGEPDGTVP